MISHVLGHRSNTFVRKSGRALAAIPKFAQQCQYCRRISLFTLCRNSRHDLFDSAELLRFVVNYEIALVPELFNVLSQNAHAQRMKSADSGPLLAGFRGAS